MSEYFVEAIEDAAKFNTKKRRVLTGNSTKCLVLNNCEIPDSTFKSVRMKGLTSFSFLAQKPDLENGLKTLLLGPIDPVKWKNVHADGSKGPQHDIHLDDMCIGL